MEGARDRIPSIANPIKEPRIMKVEKQNGHDVLTAHIFKAHELQEGSRWIGG